MQFLIDKHNIYPPIIKLQIKFAITQKEDGYAANHNRRMHASANVGI